MIKKVLIQFYLKLPVSLAVCLALWNISAGAQQAANPAPGNLFPLSSFAAGQKFAIQTDSFTPIGDGKLQYRVVETSGQSEAGPRVSLNEIDCSTGQLRAPIKSWNEGGDGNISNEIPGSPYPVTLRNRTRLYAFLKSTCQESMPDLPSQW